MAYPIAPEVVACMQQARSPSTEEVARVAEAVWRDMTTGRSAFAWGDLTEDSSERLISMRVAGAALGGIA